MEVKTLKTGIQILSTTLKDHIKTQAKLIEYKDFKSVIAAMKSDFSSDIFG